MAEITVCIPAYNEEKALARTVEDVCAAAEAAGADFEVLVVNDGSIDRTGVIADELATCYERVTALHQRPNKGVGAAFKLALDHASSDRITLIPGDHAFDRRGLEAVFRNPRAADLIITYRANKATRPPLRRLLSTVFSGWLRIMTRCPIRDGHSLFVFPVGAARRLTPLMPDDHRYHVVSLVHLLRQADTYAEIPVDLHPRADKSSSVMRLSFLIKITDTMVRLTAGALALDRARPKARPVTLHKLARSPQDALGSLSEGRVTSPGAS